MGYSCELCKKKVGFGRSISRRGKAKYLGGVGQKVTGITKRKFKPNLQRIQVLVNGGVKRMRVCTKCMRSGLAPRPIKHKPFTIRSK